MSPACAVPHSLERRSKSLSARVPAPLCAHAKKRSNNNAAVSSIARKFSYSYLSLFDIRLFLMYTCYINAQLHTQTTTLRLRKLRSTCAQKRARTLTCARDRVHVYPVACAGRCRPVQEGRLERPSGARARGLLAAAPCRFARTGCASRTGRSRGDYVVPKLSKTTPPVVHCAGQCLT